MSDARHAALQSPSPLASAYHGRFAPSPTGALHAGSVVAALASWLDARAHRGQWLVRIEDVDGPRCVSGADATILTQLEALGLRPDEPPQWQSRHAGRFEAALDRLAAGGWAYPCACTRADIAHAMAQLGRRHERHGDLVYPGTCRAGLHGRAVRAVRMLAASTPARPQSGLSIAWSDRRLGVRVQDVAETVGDFVLKRADGLWAYQLAVVVDDAHQRITHVVRGEDLADNTPRQIHLQRGLGLATPQYLHTPLVLGADGAKLSKQNGARPIDTGDPLAVLREAGAVLGLCPHADTVAAWLDSATLQWRARWVDGIAR